MTDGEASDAAGHGPVPARLRALAGSPHPPDRWEAGQGLAALAGRPEADALLHRLLLDEYDTATTYETAEALLARRDRRGTRLVARAVGEADPRDLTFEYLGEAVNDVWLQTVEDVGLARRLCQQLTEDPEPAVRTGATLLLHLVATGSWPALPPPAHPSTLHRRLWAWSRRRAAQ